MKIIAGVKKWLSKWGEIMAKEKDEIVIGNGFDKAKQAGVKSRKICDDKKDCRQPYRQGEYCWDTSGAKDTFDAPRLAEKNHRYGSSLIRKGRVKKWPSK